MKHVHKQRKARLGRESHTAAWKTIAGAAVLSAVGTLGAGAQNVSSSTDINGNSGLTGRETGTASAETGRTPGSRPLAGQHHFDIAAGELTAALEAFGHSTGLRVHSAIPTDKLAGFQTRGIKGVYTPADALRALLSGTGLDGRVETPDKVEISVSSSERVEVNASVAAIGLQQFPQPLLDTAQTVNVVPQYILSEQADTTLRDSLRNVPGISIAAGEGGSQGDSLTIRGFNARNDIFLDGIRDFGSYYRDSFDYASVDVLEGPASVEFGRGSTGGVVNQETKQPGLANFATASVQLGTDALRRGSADFERVIPAIPGGTAFRLNVVGEESGVAGRAITETRRWGVAPAISFGLNTHTRATLSYLHEFEDSIPDYGLPYFGAAVAAVPTGTYYGVANGGNFLRTRPDVATARVEHDYGLHATVRNALRWGNYPRLFRITEPQINTTGTISYKNADGRNVYENANTVINVACAIAATAAASCYPVNTPLSQVYVKRNQLNGASTEDILWDQVSASLRFNVKRVANSATVLVEGGRERSDPYRPGYTLPYVAALNPNPYDPFAPTAVTAAVTTHVASESYGIDFLDMLELTHWLELSGGVRFDYFSTQSGTPANLLVTPNTMALVTERLDKQPTYRAAVVVKPRPQGSVYFDWGTSFNPAAESLSLSGNNATSPPEYNQTFELGAKWEFLHDRLNLNGSVFRTEKLNARETDPNNSSNVINAGNQLVRGVQIGALGHLPNSFDLILGYAYLNGVVESSVVNASPFTAATYGNCPAGTPATAYGSAVTCSLNTAMINAHDPRANTAPFYVNPAGFPLANVPKNSGNFWVTHRLFFRFVGGFGGNYVAARRASSTSVIGIYNTQAAQNVSSVPFAYKAIPGYALLNLMLRRPITERLDLQANVNNITNKFFIDQPHPNHLVPGEGVNAQIGFNYKF